MAHVYLGLGANVGEAEAQIEKAVEALKVRATVIGQAPVYVTRPFGDEEQFNFYNSAVHISTDLDPYALRAWVKEIEVALGRVPRQRNGPREIDIDILLYDNLVLHDEVLVLPHVGLTTRDFVMVPLLDITQDLCDPCTGRPLKEFLDALEPADRYVYRMHPHNLKVRGII